MPDNLDTEKVHSNLWQTKNWNAH